jgi:transposase InsO family protein
MDLASRRIVGWSMSERMTADLVCQAVKSAYWKRKPPAGLIMHTDRYRCLDRRLLQSSADALGTRIQTAKQRRRTRACSISLLYVKTGPGQLLVFDCFISKLIGQFP